MQKTEFKEGDVVRLTEKGRLHTFGTNYQTVAMASISWKVLSVDENRQTVNMIHNCVQYRVDSELLELVTDNHREISSELAFYAENLRIEGTLYGSLMAMRANAQKLIDKCKAEELRQIAVVRAKHEARME
jgi:hypothetical protein